MHRTLAVVLFGLSLLMTKQVAALCPNPLPVGMICCGYATHVCLRSDSPAGCPGGPGTPRATTAHLVNSFAECRAAAQPVHDKEARRYGCLLPVDYQFNYWPTPPDPTNTVHQNFFNRYVELVPPSTLLRRDCLDLTGGISWTVVPTPPPPPPPPPPVTVICPIYDLAPKPTDACSQMLEANFGVIPASNATSNICPQSTVMTDLLGEPCLKRKLAAQGITDLTVPAYKKPTSTYRTPAYQNHLADLWNKFTQHSYLPLSADQIKACATRRTIVMAEQNGPPAPGHKLGYEPIGTSHEADAFDIDGAVVAALQKTKPGVQAYLDASVPGDAACKLKWGGGYDVPDIFHFVTKP